IRHSRGLLCRTDRTSFAMIGRHADASRTSRSAHVAMVVFGMPLEHRTEKTFAKGSHYPLGATVTPDGVNFAVYSQHATDVFLLLFDEPDADPTDVIQLVNRDRFVSHALVRGLGPGQLYGYKARGDYVPEWGLRFNDRKLLLDPYA